MNKKKQTNKHRLYVDQNTESRNSYDVPYTSDLALNTNQAMDYNFRLFKGLSDCLVSLGEVLK